MATVLTNDANYTAIADAIRAKGGEGTFTPAQMATAIANLPSGGANKVLTSAIITGTSSKIDISNYTTDNNFILFFGLSSGSYYTRYIFTPSMPWTTSYATEYGGQLLYNTNRGAGIEIPSSGFTKIYGVSNSDKNSLAIGDFLYRDYLSYSNGIITAKDSRHPFATSSILIYLAEATI